MDRYERDEELRKLRRYCNVAMGLMVAVGVIGVLGIVQHFLLVGFDIVWMLEYALIPLLTVAFGLLVGHIFRKLTLL